MAKFKKRKLSDYIQFHPKQLEAWRYIGTGAKIFYGGARGGGKSHLSLVAALLCAMKYPGLQIVIIRETYGELKKNFVRQLQDRYPAELFGYTYTAKYNEAVFKNKSVINFQACDSEKAVKKVQGVEYQLMIIDEANNFDEEVINLLSGSIRRGQDYGGFIPTLLMTGNPGGSADLYFKTRYVNPDYKRWSDAELKHKEKYIFIPAFVQDNPSVGEEYVDMLESIPDEARRNAWLYGDWNVFSGQFFDSWNAKVHIVEPFNIPEHWLKVAGIDIGYTSKHPTVCLWLAQDPENLDVYVYREYAQAGAIETFVYDIKGEAGEEAVSGYYGDPSMFNSAIKTKETDDTVDMMFLKEGIPLLKANNSRVNGWRITKAWMHWTARKAPKLKFFDTCSNCIETIPILKYAKSASAQKKEDLDTKMADDAADALRYVLVSAFGFPTASELDIHAKTYIAEEQNERDKEEESYGREIRPSYEEETCVTYSSCYI